jgi:hypothetical protein
MGLVGNRKTYTCNEIAKVSKLVPNSNFVSFTCDEVIAIYNTNWTSVHGYIMHGWCHIPMLLNVGECTLRWFIFCLTVPIFVEFPFFGHL